MIEREPGRSGRERLTGPARVLAILLAVFGGDQLARAEDHGQLGTISPEVRAWASTLENKRSQGCCSSADGWKPEETEYDIVAGRYRVRIEGRWYDVPDEAVLQGPNKFGFPVVWYYRSWDNGIQASIQIRCFIPGAGG
jgi:hypothetical protein